MPRGEAPLHAKRKECMDSDQNKSYDTLVRVKDFGAIRATEFPAASLGGQMFVEMAAIVSELENLAGVQAASATFAVVGSETKAVARKRLRENLRAIRRTALAVVTDNPELKKTFRLPTKGDKPLLNGARAFLEAVEPMAADFAKHEMPDVVAGLRGNIDAFQSAVTQRNHSTERRIKATASLDAVLAHGMKVLHRLDAIVSNKYANDKPSLSAWESASHVERTSEPST